MTPKAKPDPEDLDLDEAPMPDAQLDGKEDAAEEPISFPVTVQLRHPLRHGKEEIDTLHLRELTAGDLLGLGSSDTLGMEDTLRLIGRSATLPPSVLKQLRPHDLSECIGWVKRFLQPLQGGGTSSRP